MNALDRRRLLLVLIYAQRPERVPVLHLAALPRRPHANMPATAPPAAGTMPTRDSRPGRAAGGTP